MAQLCAFVTSCLFLFMQPFEPACDGGEKLYMSTLLLSIRSIKPYFIKQLLIFVNILSSLSGSTEVEKK